MTQEIGVGLVGYKFMGRAHSNAYRQVAAFFPEVKLRPATVHVSLATTHPPPTKVTIS